MTGLLDPLIDRQLPLSRAQRRAVTRAAWSRWMKHPLHLTLYAGGLIAAFAAFMILPGFIEPLLGGHRAYFSLIWLGLYAMSVFGVIMAMRKVGFAPCVYAELREWGFDVCRQCGYLLTGLAEDTSNCPECGATRTPFGSQ